MFLKSPDSFRLLKRAELFLCIAVTGWVASFWLCKGPREQVAWFNWFFLPALLWNGGRVLALWRSWSYESKRWWILFGALIVWQFLITGFRGGNWWKGSGAGKDAWMIFCMVSGLSLVGCNEKSRSWLWSGVFVLGGMCILLSLFVFYSQVALDEERFRLCWRQWPGFDAVTTGIFTGMALMAGLISGNGGHRWWNPCRSSLLAVLGFGLAASESRGALLAVTAGAIWWLTLHFRSWHRLSWPVGGFAVYWLLVQFAGLESSGLIERGSSGRLDIYQTYLSQIKGIDWLIGKGVVHMLPESVLGWLVYHPHNAYLGQLTGYGMIGLVWMLATLVWGWLTMRHSPESAILIFGLVTILFDGGVVFSLFSIARWEVLVVMVPLVMGVAGSGRKQDLRFVDRTSLG